MVEKVLLISFLFFGFGAGQVLAVDFTNSVPDISSSNLVPKGDFIGWVQNFYQFSLIAGVFLAVGVITWAGLRYALGAGNPTTQSDARDQILQAILGLTLLFGAYLVLNTIDPKLINLRLEDLKSVSVPAAQNNSANTNVVLYKCDANGATFGNLAQCTNSCPSACTQQTGENNNNPTPANNLGNTNTGGI